MNGNKASPRWVHFHLLLVSCGLIMVHGSGCTKDVCDTHDISHRDPSKCLLSRAMTSWAWCCLVPVNCLMADVRWAYGTAQGAEHKQMSNACPTLTVQQDLFQGSNSSSTNLASRQHCQDVGQACLYGNAGATRHAGENKPCCTHCSVSSIMATFGDHVVSLSNRKAVCNV